MHWIRRRHRQQDSRDAYLSRELTNNDNYKYPGPEHLAFVTEYTENDVEQANPLTVEEAFQTLLNGDVHIRGSLFGYSETFILCDGTMAIGLVDLFISLTGIKTGRGIESVMFRLLGSREREW